MMYSLYVVLKYALYWMVIAFKDPGDAICNGVSSTYHTIATYEGTPYLCSFLVYLYNTCYAAGSVMYKGHVL